MNAIKHRFVLDMHSAQSQISIPALLGDTNRELHITLTDGGNPYTITEGCLAKISIKRPSGTFLEEFCTIEGGTTVVYPFSENTCVVEGIHECDLTLYDPDGEVIASPRFTMVVSDRVINRDDINLSDEDKSAIDLMIAAEASRQAAETGRVNAEALRQTAETARAEAETARQTAESARVTAETARANGFNSLKGEVDTAVKGIVSPTIAVKQTDDGYKMTVTDKEGTKDYDLLLGVAFPTAEEASF